MRKIGIFGGSFNPVHTGHLILGQFTLEKAELDEIFFVPASRPPHKPHTSLAPAEHRMEMLRLACKNNPAFKISDIEINRSGPSYTLTTVRQMMDNYSESARLFLILGADSVRDIHKWYRAKELVKSVPMIGLRRPDTDHIHMEGNQTFFSESDYDILKNCFIDIPQIEISSSYIRERIRARKPVRYLVTETVRQYIISKKLYC